MTADETPRQLRRLRSEMLGGFAMVAALVLTTAALEAPTGLAWAYLALACALLVLSGASLYLALTERPVNPSEDAR